MTNSVVKIELGNDFEKAKAKAFVLGYGEKCIVNSNKTNSNEN